MPRYEYICTNKECGKTATAIRKVEDRDKTFKCVCGSTFERTVSLPSNPVFKGGGWTGKFHR